jgi:hypothetical protein
LRELTFVEEELKQLWARKMKELLLSMKAEVEQAKAAGQHELDVLVLAPSFVAMVTSSPKAISPILPQPPRSEQEGDPNKVLPPICWIDSFRGSGPSSASCTILPCLLTTM